MLPRSRRNPVRTSIHPLVFLALLGLPNCLGAACGATRVAKAQPTIWEPLEVGAGGWITGVDACKAGTTFVLRTDTYGGYVGNPALGVNVWRQLVRADSMPASFVAGMGDSLGEGVYELRVAPSDCNRLYMTYKGKIYRSVDRGATWTETGFSQAGAVDPNDTYRIWGEKMAVDPANPDVVYAGTPAGGLFVTTDGGASWSAVAGVPVPASAAGITGIVFDESSGVAGGRTSTVYATSNGNGVYRSTDAGLTWASLAGGPATVTHAAVARDGVYFAVDMGTSAYRYTGGSWSSTASAGVQLHSIATDPFDAARIIGGRDSGHLVVSTDRGASWGAGPIWKVTRIAADVPWLAFANEAYMSNGAMRFDPTVPNKLWFAEGIGLWYSTAPDDAKGTTWYSASAGIEQLVARDVAIPPGSDKVITAGMDRSIFVLPRANTAYPARYGTEATPSASLIPAWAVSWAATAPSHLVAVINHGPELSGYSTDGGLTWTRFPTMPAGSSGDIAATSLDAIVAVIGGGYAWRTTDRGATWTALSLPGASDTPSERQNLHNGYNCKKHILAIDGVDLHTVYLHFYGHGIYRSSDDGASWALVSARDFDGSNAFWQTKLRSVPGRAGHLFLTAGQAGAAGAANPADTHLWRSTDGGATWAAVPGMAEPYDVALGKAAPGASYPTIYVVGWYRGAYGIWRSTDDAATWTDIGPFPFGSIDEINVIAASQDVYGDVYVAFQGSGWGYGRLASPP